VVFCAPKNARPWQSVEKGAIDWVPHLAEAYRGKGGVALLRDDEDDLNDQDSSSGRKKHEQGAIFPRHADKGVEGLLRDKTRKPGKAPLPAATVAKVLVLTCSDPPGETTHWTGRAMARTVGISLRAVQRILEANPSSSKLSSPKSNEYLYLPNESVY